MLPNIYTQERVSEYLSRGFAPIPMKHKSKLPVSARWPELRITQNDIPKYFNGHATNIGVLTGEPSQGLVDVDIDDTTALRFAPRFLPETNCILVVHRNPGAIGSTGFLSLERISNFKPTA